MTENHIRLRALWEEYLEANDKFENKGIKAQAVKARKVLMEIGKLTKARRAEIQDKKNAM
jgi:hypothetical protein